MKAVLRALAAALAALCAAQVPAQGRSENARWCAGDRSGENGVPVELRIRGCTALIEAREAKPRAVAEALLHRSAAYEWMRDLDRATADLERAIAVDPQFGRAWARNCLFHISGRPDRDRARKECDTAIRLDPQGADGYAFRGDLYLESRDYERAMQDFNQATLRSPAWVWPWNDHGEALLRLRQPRRAMRDFERVIEIAPENPLGFLNRGCAYLMIRRFSLAQQDFESALKFDPRNASALLARGLVKRQTGDVAGGDADVAAARAIRPKVGADWEELYGIRVP